MAYTFKKRVGPISYSQVKNLIYYKVTNPFEVNSATGGNCTWYAWGRFWEVWAQVKTEYKSKMPKAVCKSNACYFYSDGLKNGFKGGMKPKPGALACWGYNGASHGNPGHVAFVEKVNMKNGNVESIEISQSGWSSGPLKNQILKPGSGTKGTGSYKLGYMNSYFNGFIYNPVDFGNPAGAVGSSSSDSKSPSWYISKYGTGAQVYFELKKYGYTHKACCAVLGNMQQESGIRVYTGGSYDGNGSEGLCQWTFGRKRTMMTYATEHSASKTWKSVDGQVAYLVYELEHTEKAANKVLKTNSFTLDQMTEEFEKAFERAGKPNMAARKKYAHEWDTKMSTAEDASGADSTATVDMKTRISKLYSSANYNDYVYQENNESAYSTQIKENQKKLKDFLSNASFSAFTKDTGAFPEAIVGKGAEKTKKEILVRTQSQFSLSESLVQAPFVEVTFNNYTVGSYKGSTDDYPNYISSLDVQKINGEINQYTISLIHQIRPGEDPNLIDKLLSTVRYDKISIRYGDCESGALFKDSEAIITNVVNNRDYASSRISYTIYATSACNYVTSIKFDFPGKIDKPSNVIRDLLYNNINTSNILLETFPGMRDRTKVESSNLLPTNDTVLNINSKKNMDVISYINYLVGCMSNASLSNIPNYAKDIVVGAGNISKDIITGIGNTAKDIITGKDDTIRNSSYYITYDDNKDGAFFKISEIALSNSKSILTNNIFEVTVGYPDGNDIYDFKVTNNEAWSLLFDNQSVSSEYLYGINNTGQSTLQYSPNLISSSNVLNEIQKNWWTQMTTYPISAQLVMRGLLKPVSLMDYVKVNVVFYGQKHITSGLYVVIGEQDILSGSGFMTNLSLLRVGD